jgi:23S rRNA pseudouridine955/2504/2580 synthase
LAGAVAALPASVRHLLVDEGSVGQRLDNFLLRELKGVPKTHVYRVIRSGEVRVNAGRAGADTRLAVGDKVRVPPLRLPARLGHEAAPDTVPPREFVVLFEDEHLLAIDKPAGVAVHGGSGVSFGVIEQLRRARPQAKFLELVHRLDKETSGVLLLAKKRSALNTLQAQFRERETDKRYSALVFGAWPAKLKLIDSHLLRGTDAQGERHVRVVAAGSAGAQRAITTIRIEQSLGTHPGAQATLLDVGLKTGRTHQIRVHLAGQGHPIVGDAKYGDFARNKALAKALGAAGSPGAMRMALHARELRFAHPASGEALRLHASLPAELLALVHALVHPRVQARVQAPAIGET